MSDAFGDEEPHQFANAVAGAITDRDGHVVHIFDTDDLRDFNHGGFVNAVLKQ